MTSLLVCKKAVERILQCVSNDEECWLIGIEGIIIGCFKGSWNDAQIINSKKIIPSGLSIVGYLAKNKEQTTKTPPPPIPSFFNLLYIAKSVGPDQVSFFSSSFSTNSSIPFEVCTEVPWSNIIIVKASCDSSIELLKGKQICLAATSINGFLVTGSSGPRSKQLNEILLLVNKQRLQQQQQQQESTSSITPHDRTLKSEMYFDLSNSTTRDGPLTIFKRSSNNEQQNVLKLNFDCICFLPSNTTLGKCHDVIVEEFTKQCENAILMNEEDNKLTDFAIAHFLPPPTLIDHPLSFLYPLNNDSSSVNSSSFVSLRRLIQNSFFLPIDRPLLHPKISARLAWFDTENKSTHQKQASKRLRNVHILLGIENGSSSSSSSLEMPTNKRFLATIKGSYDYYHYMQDGIDDNGWGCAYRSMQTICSWILLEGFTSKQVPTHKQIQQLLVQMGDKQQSFVGSKNWIGAVEISMCLQNLYGMDCRILNIQSGAQVSLHSKTLYDHFKREGTPIMIGGGVLAYTLIGIDWSGSTGDTQYLILDPHYVGPENAQQIKSHGWCSWKKSDLFLKDHFYNFCMPLLPSII